MPRKFQNIFEENDPVLKAILSVKSYFFYAMLFSACINLLMLTPIIYMLQVYDRVISSGSMSTLSMLTLLMVGLLVASGSFDWVRARILIAANHRLEHQLRDSVSKAAFRHTLNTGGTAEANQAMADLIGLRQFMTGNGVFAFMDAPWVPIYIWVMFLFHPYFGYSAIIAALIMVLFALGTEKITGRRLLEANSFSGQAQGMFGNNLRNAEVIEGMGMSETVRSQYNLLFDKASSKQAIASSYSSLITAASKSFRLIVQSLLLGLGAYLALIQEISPGMMIAGSLLLGRALAPIDLMVGSWKGFTTAKSQYSRLRNGLRSVPPEISQLELPDPRGNLKVEQIVVVPPAATTASVKGVSFKLSAGEVLGIIGPSAAGKTSLARAILGVWPLRAGTVRLDDADISQWDRSRLGPHVGYLPQDIELFHGTVGDNICRFSDRQSEEIISAAKMAGIHEMILNLPNGYDTVISPTSGALSAGQRQRLGIARALFGQPKLIILDEPNSNLDELGERELLKSVEQLKEWGSTVIIITHRTSILTLTDKLLILQDGFIKNFGERDQVLRSIKETNSKVARLTPKV